MANQKVKMLLNMGAADKKKYGLPGRNEDGDLPLAGDVLTVNEKQAHVLLHVLKCAKSYDAKEEKAQEDEAREAAAKVALPEVQAKIAKEQAEKDAAKLVKGK